MQHIRLLFVHKRGQTMLVDSLEIKQKETDVKGVKKKLHAQYYLIFQLMIGFSDHLMGGCL